MLTPSLASGTNTPLASEKDVSRHTTTDGVAGPGNEAVSMTTGDEGASGCLSKAQTLQLWDQIQQASATLCHVLSLSLCLCASFCLCCFLFPPGLFVLPQHFQLLMQTFVLTRFEPSLVFLSQIAVQAIVSVFVCVWLLQ